MKINKILVIILALFIPYILLMSGIRFVMTPAFPAMEYKRSGFPQDQFGFTVQERTKWSEYAIRYLTNDQEISYLGNLQDITGKKLFTTDELSHMVDVKEVVKNASMVWYVLGGMSIAILVWFVVMGQWDSLRRSLNAGGWITIGLLGALLVFLAVSFDRLFEYFHRIFFQDGTWTFSQSSTLIRLFPFEFWRDAFVLVIGFALIVGVVLVLLTRKRSKRQKSAS